MNLRNLKFKRPKWLPLWLSLPFVIFIAFIVMLLFYGENNYMQINDQKKEIDKINAQIKELEDSAKLYERKTQELNTDKETLEKIAREQYSMKRTNEEVFITDIP
jgi:cell division protein FtsB